jgi:uncharacterized protein (TIGR03067 family)
MNEEIEKLQGTWKMITLEVEGQKVPSLFLAGSKIVVKGSDFIANGMGATYEGKLEVDTGQVPRTLNMIFTAGPEKGNSSLGIYELDDNNWKICLTIRGSSRPTAFATAPGSGHALETLKRE